MFMQRNSRSSYITIKVNLSISTFNILFRCTVYVFPQWNEYYPEWIVFYPVWTEIIPVWIVFSPGLEHKILVLSNENITQNSSS